MKTIFKTLLLLSIASLLCFSSCKKEKKGTTNIFKQKRPTELPPITTEGKNTFGCYVDGELLVPFPRRAIKDNFRAFYYGVKWDDLNGTLEVGANMEGDIGYSSKSAGIYIQSSVFDTGEYVLYTDIAYNAQGLSYLRRSAGVQINNEKGETVFDSWRVPSTDCGRMNILRLDTVARILSGTFYFDAINKEGDTVKVTDGRFDFTY
ncbi:MAG: hypothetical protein J5I91_03410 [Bacteroidetes bacterium]|nr:hypothetical protein [Bacteroidota bacterium]